MKKLFLIFWALSGLLTLDLVLNRPHSQPAPRSLDAAPDARGVIGTLKTSCQLPPGTVVFVVRAGQP